jgi:DNA-directed RNA polymerase subunit RPC12/RpoP
LYGHKRIPNCFTNAVTVTSFIIGLIAGFGISNWFLNKNYSTFKDYTEKLIKNLENDIANKSKELDYARAQAEQYRHDCSNEKARYEAVSKILVSDTIRCKACGSSIQFTTKHEDKTYSSYVYNFKCSLPSCGLNFTIDEYNFKKLYNEKK